MADPCACAHGVPARANSLYCADCYRLGCEPGACNRERPTRACSGCIKCAPPIVVKADDGCDGTGRIPLDFSTARSWTEYRSRARAEQDYEDELWRRDERSGR